VIYVDANVPMYLVGDDERRRAEALVAVHRVARRDELVVTSAETFQELLHRYRAIDREDALQRAWDQTLAIVDDVLPITYADVDRAKGVQLARRGVTARDALHLAVMERHGITAIASFDAVFDAVPEIERIA
jgi:predicted nucleic acid-binding protein